MDGEDDVLPSEQQELERGLELIGDGAYFEAHEVLEGPVAPRVEAEERDFYQGLVHVAVAWHHAGRGNRPGFERQLAKAARRLSHAPTHRGVDIADLLTQIESASFATLVPVRVNRSALDANTEELEHTVEPDVQPPEAVEEKQPEGDEQRRSRS